RHIDHRRVRALQADRFLDGVVHRHLLEAGDLAAALARRDAGDDARAVLDHLLGVERTRRAGHALDDELGVVSDEDAHLEPPAALTTFCAPSAMSAAAMMLSPLSASIFLPSSTFVPSSRTTSGTLRPTSFVAAITPAAIVSHFMMPPKMLTKI